MQGVKVTNWGYLIMHVIEGSNLNSLWHSSATLLWSHLSAPQEQTDNTRTALSLSSEQAMAIDHTSDTSLSGQGTTCWHPVRVLSQAWGNTGASRELVTRWPCEVQGQRAPKQREVQLEVRSLVMSYIWLMGPQAMVTILHGPVEQCLW